VSFPRDGVTQGALLESLAREAPDRCALDFPALGVAWTFSALDGRSRRLARGLVALGVAHGDRVAVWATNSPDWIALQFAIARIGAVLVTANPQLAPPEIEYLLRQSRTSVLVGERALLQRGDVPPNVRHVVAIENLDDLVRAGDGVTDAVIDARCAATSPSDAANIQYTSGTTGFPKGVVLTHANVVGNAFTMARLLDVRAGERLLLTVPLFHCFGCVIVVLGAFTHAATLVGFARFDPETILGTNTAIHLAYGVPTMYRALLDHPCAPLRARAGLMAGAPCPEPLMRRVIEEMCPGIVVAYGLTEASPSCTSGRPGDRVDERCTSAGRAIDGVDVRIAADTGEVQVRGPNVMRGYFDDPAATAAAFTADGWLRTGDIGTIDETGLVRITGRLKELIKRGGENVWPAEVEDALRAHPAVADAAVFGVPSEYWGEEVAAAVVLRPGAAADAAELLAFVAPRLAKFKLPVRIAFVASLPMTASGKVQKFKLAAAFGGG
jgi:fatty-acyl-CoA synthase